MTATMTGACECGTPVERQQATGFGADLLNAMPLRCDDCIAHDTAESDRRERETAVAKQARDRERAIENSGLPSELRNISLDTLDPTGCHEAITAARHWVEHGRGLLFTGPFGTGKTTIAAAALRLRIHRGYRDRWASAPLLMARLGSGFGTPQREWALEALTGATGLILDDLDKTRPTEYGSEQVFLGVDGAVTNGRPLIVTTNLSLGELAAKWPEPYGEAIVSRLAGYCAVVQLTGPDRRLTRTR